MNHLEIRILGHDRQVANERKMTMKLADKIVKLRKQFGWSQEELAEKMEVSRQSVSKWESAMSIPDLNKILRLAEIFGVSTDFLLKDEMEVMEPLGEDVEEGVIRVSIDQVNDYEAAKTKIGNIVSNGVYLLIVSSAPMFILMGLSYSGYNIISENLAIGIGMGILLVIVAGAIGMMIHTEKYKKGFDTFEKKKFELQYGVESIVKERSEDFRPTYARHMAIGISLLILGSLTIILGGVLDGSDQIMMYMLATLLVIVGKGVHTLAQVGSRKEVYDLLLKEGKFSPANREEYKRAEKLAAFYWPLVTAIYLGWSFWTMDWHISWIIWPVAGVIFPALIGLMGLFSKD